MAKLVIKEDNGDVGYELSKTLTSLGFKLKGKPDESNKMFFTVSMVKASEKKAKKVKWQPLKACIYKRR